jgi:hypothetical protein
VETIHASSVHDCFKCHRNVTMQTKPLQRDNLITNKYGTILEASRTILNTQCVKIYVLASVKNF